MNSGESLPDKENLHRKRSAADARPEVGPNREVKKARVALGPSVPEFGGNSKLLSPSGNW